MKSKCFYGKELKATPLHYCETVEEAIPYLTKGFKGDEETGSILSSAIHSVENVELLAAFLKHGANPNSGEPKSVPLHTQSEPKMLKLLLEYGANVNSQNKWGDTPLHVCKSLISMKLLFEYGANPNIRNSVGELPEGDWDQLKDGMAMRAGIIEYRKGFK